jgi:hypothetical protein
MLLQGVRYQLPPAKPRLYDFKFTTDCSFSFNNGEGIACLAKPVMYLDSEVLQGRSRSDKVLLEQAHCKLCVPRLDHGLGYTAGIALSTR